MARQDTQAERIERAKQLHQDGDLTAAEALYKRVLAQNPAHCDALHYLGILEAQGGDYRKAIELLAAALALEPDSPVLHIDLGNVLAEAGRPEEAVSHYDHALARAPRHIAALALYSRGNVLHASGRHSEALASYDEALTFAPEQLELINNRANTLFELERYEEALACYDRALAIAPELALLHNNRGNCLKELRRSAEALESFDRALRLAPDYADALNNRGNVLLEIARYDEALASFERAVRIDPANAVVHNNRGNALQEMGRPDEALQSYDRALAITPDSPEALNNRGNALRSLRRHDDAVASYDRALLLRPAYAEALNNRGSALQGLGRHEEALASYDRALAVSPDFAEALNNRGTLQVEVKCYDDAALSYARLVEIAPGFEYALGNLFHAQLRCCDWKRYAATAPQIVTAVRSGQRADLPFAFLVHSHSAADQLRCARTYVADKYQAHPQPLWSGERYRHDRIRVAYLSADFYEHPVAQLIAGVFEAHDRARFEISAIYYGPDRRDEMRERLERSVERFVDVRTSSDREVAQLLRRLEIDIAVDLKAFTEDCRPGILASRPAPIQVNYLGYPGTTGASYIDYLIADHHLITETDSACYSERVVYLPDTYQANDSKRRIAQRTPERAEVDLPQTGFVFCSFNNSFKISPAIFDVWMRLLQKVEGSVLWLLGDNAAGSRNLRREAAKRDVAPERVVFAPRAQVDAYRARYRLADLFLDTLPYNAHTTASDALWAGLPILTCTGGTFAGRVAGSLLKAVGLPELITGTLEEYEALALDLATTPPMLADLRARLIGNRDTCPLFDTERFRRNIESAYATMWTRYQRGEQPDSFEVHELGRAPP